MSTLKELQEGFQKALLDGDLTILSQIPDSPLEDKKKLLGVYQYAYSARLTEFLENDYPQLHSYLGDRQFEEMCKAYIAKTPSHNPNARWYGTKLPDFISNTAPYNKQAQLHDLARLECSLNIVFDESEETPLGLDQLTQIAPDQWPTLVFAPVTSTRRLDLSSNATELWNALVSETEPPDVIFAEEPLHILIFRDQFQSSFRSMDYAEAMMWDKMAAGVPFGVLCELMATYGGEDDAAMRVGSFLHAWISAGLIFDNFASDQAAPEF